MNPERKYDGLLCAQEFSLKKKQVEYYVKMY